MRRVTYPFDRGLSFDLLAVTFLARHFERLQALVYEHLPAPVQKLFDRATDPDAEDSLFLRTGFDRRERGLHATDPDAEDSLFRQPDVESVCLNAVYLASPK